MIYTSEDANTAYIVAAIMTSMKHMCFLRDPRTDVVVGEPRADLPIIPKLVKALPQEVNRVCSFVSIPILDIKTNAG